MLNQAGEDAGRLILIQHSAFSIQHFYRAAAARNVTRYVLPGSHCRGLGTRMKSSATTGARSAPSITFTSVTRRGSIWTIGRYPLWAPFVFTGSNVAAPRFGLISNVYSP